MEVSLVISAWFSLPALNHSIYTQKTLNSITNCLAVSHPFIFLLCLSLSVQESLSYFQLGCKLLKDSDCVSDLVPVWAPMQSNVGCYTWALNKCFWIKIFSLYKFWSSVKQINFILLFSVSYRNWQNSSKRFKEHENNILLSWKLEWERSHKSTDMF